jgi:hypothetical protein
MEDIKNTDFCFFCGEQYIKHQIIAEAHYCDVFLQGERHKFIPFPEEFRYGAVSNELLVKILKTLQSLDQRMKSLEGPPTEMIVCKDRDPIIEEQLASKRLEEDLEERERLLKYFSFNMKRRLSLHDKDRGVLGWRKDCPLIFLVERIQDKVDDLGAGINSPKVGPKQIDAAVDIANFAMMIADKMSLELSGLRSAKEQI